MKKYIFFCGIIVLLVLNVACVNGTKMDVISFPVNATETVYCLDKDTLYDTDVYLTFNKEDNGTVVISSLITSIEYYMKGKLKIKNYKRFATSKFPDTTEFLCCLQESMAKASKKYPLDSLKYIYCNTFDFPDETVELSLAMDTVKPIERMEDFSRWERRVNSLLRASGFYSSLDTVLRDYHLKVDTIMAKDGNEEVEFMNSDKENFSKNRTLGHHSKMPNVIVGTILTVVITPLN